MKIICVGRNFADHASELGNPLPESPVLFMKPETALVEGDAIVTVPEFTDELHYECELVLRIARRGKALSEEEAVGFFDAVGIGIDFTARDLQTRLKSRGLPWEKAKGFDQSAIVSDLFLKKRHFADLGRIGFRMEKNGEVVQQGMSSDMKFDFAALLADMSRYFTLEPGDLVYTGTPAGVGPARPGDLLVCYIEEREMLRVEMRGA